MSQTRSGGYTPFVPLLILGLGFLLWSSFQTVQLVRERSQLQAAHAGQNQLIDTSQTVRAALDKLATETQRLADGGNANAQLLVEELRNRGVTINAGGSSGP